MGALFTRVSGLAIHVERQPVDVDLPALVAREHAHIRYLGYRFEADVPLERDVEVVRFRQRLLVPGRRHVDGVFDQIRLRRGRDVAEPRPPYLLLARYGAAARERIAAAVARRSGEVVEDAPRAAQRGFAVAEHVPGKPDSRRVHEVRECEVGTFLLARNAAGLDPVDLAAGARDEVAGRRRRQEHRREGRVNRPLVGRRALLTAGNAGRADQSIHTSGLVPSPLIGEKAAVHVVEFKVGAAVLNAEAEVEGQPRGDPPVILEIEVVLPVADVPVDAARQLAIGGEIAEQQVGVAVARAERVVGVVAEIEVPHVVGGARLGLAVVLEGYAHLEVVAPFRDRHVVAEDETGAEIQLRNREITRRVM